MTLESERVPITPVTHNKGTAKIEVTISENGEFCDAEFVDNTDGKDGLVIYPVTEKSSGSRTGKSIAPHAFSDELQYLAGDYYCDSSDQTKENPKFTKYILQLKEWRDSKFSHPSVQALYLYLSQKTLVKDLIKSGILMFDENGKIISCRKKGTDVHKWFVRFRVLNPSAEERTWLDTTLYDRYVQYYTSGHSESSLCYATGEQTYCIDKHPFVVGTLKLFSTQKETNDFKYSGRFENADQAVSIGYDFSSKMHNALKWLIDRQSVPLGKEKTVIVWNSVLSKIPDSFSASEDIFKISNDDFDDIEMDFNPFPDTFTSYKNAIQRSIFGYKNDIDFEQKVLILMLEAANSNGRIAITMYNELSETEFYENVKNWHTYTAWNRYDFKQKKNYIGSFALPQIAEYAYGTEQSGKMACKPEIKGDIIARLIPCVTEGRDLPTDILRQLVNRASRRTAYDRKNRNWDILLEITCGMIRKHYIEEGRYHGMALDRNCPDRNYLFGRYLAWAEVAERSTFRGDENHQTNAERFFEKFSSNPAAAIETIEKRLKPYLNRMSPGKRWFYEQEHDEILDKLDANNFINNNKLDPLYLLGYSHERHELRNNRKNKDDNSEEE